MHTHALRHVSSLLTDDVAQTVACSIIASRLDYCNALLSGAPVATFDKLQRTQNNLARVVSRAGVAPTPGRCFAATLASSEAAGHLKVALLTHKVRTSATPTYLSTPRALQSSDAPLLVVLCTHTELSHRAFSVAAPSTWNSLPADVQLCENIFTFKRHLRTHLFKLT